MPNDLGHQLSGEGAAPATATATETSQSAASSAAQAGIDARRGQGIAPANTAATRRGMTPRLSAQIQAYSNTRYHEDRQSFFEAVNRWANLFTILLGSGAAATAMSTHPHIAVFAGAATALIGAAQLVFDFSGKSRTHLELRKTFARLMADAQHPDCDPELIQARIAEAYEGEPEVFYAVNALAYNAAQMAFDRGLDTTVLVGRWQKAMRHVFHFDPSDFPDRAPAA